MCVITWSLRHSLIAVALPVVLGFSGLAVADGCEMDETDRALLNQVNEARSQPRQCGDKTFEAAPPLAWNCKLEDAARAHAEAMVELEFFSHTGPDGVQTGRRVSDRGYSWSAVGENIASGQNSVNHVVDGWLSSPGHCANIMNTEFTEMGAARVEAPGSPHAPFWTQVFARPL